MSKQNNKGRGKTYHHRKPQGRKPNFPKTEKPQETCPTSNDIKWYNKSINYTDATSVQRNRIFAMLYNDYSVNARQFGASGSQPPKAIPCFTALNDGKDVAASIPSVIGIHYVPHIGPCVDQNSPVNRSFTSLMSEIAAHTNTSNLGFQTPDLAMFTLSAETILANIEFVKKVLGLNAMYYDSTGALPHVLANALRTDYSLIMDNSEQYRVKLNSLIQNLNELMIPDYLDSFARARQLAGNTYSDEEALASNLYTFVPEGYYVWDSINKVMEFILYDLDESGELNLVEQVLDAIEEQLNALRNSSDTWLICAAIRRAFPESIMIKEPFFTVGEQSRIVYDRNMTWQINNLNTVPVLDYASLDIDQDPVHNTIVAKPRITVHPGMGAKFLANEIVLNSYNGDLSNEFIMESTRLVTLVGDDYYIAVCGCQIATRMYVYSQRRDPDTTDIVYTVRGLETDYNFRANVNATPAQTVELFTKGLQQLCDVTKFKNCPQINIFTSTTIGGVDGTTNLQHVGILGDTYHTLVISKEELEQIQLAAYQSIYLVKIPSLSL